MRSASQQPQTNWKHAPTTHEVGHEHFERKANPLVPAPSSLKYHIAGCTNCPSLPFVWLFHHAPFNTVTVLGPLLSMRTLLQLNIYQCTHPSSNHPPSIYLIDLYHSSNRSVYDYRLELLLLFL